MQRFLRFIVLLMMVWSWAFPAHALICRHYQNQEMCIVTIKRSAKNYWEYRASVRVEGVTKPIRAYDCRTRKIIFDNPILEEFEQDGTAEVVCSFFKRPWDAFGVASGKARSLAPNFEENDPTRLKTP